MLRQTITGRSDSVKPNSFKEIEVESLLDNWNSPFLAILDESMISTIATLETGDFSMLTKIKKFSTSLPNCIKGQNESNEPLGGNGSISP